MRSPKRRSGVALAMRAGLAFWLWVMGWGLPVLAADWQPTERTDQPWKVVSLLEDGGLDNLNVFNLDFERNTNSARWGTAWIATSDGLHEYDGYTWRRHGRNEGLPSDFVRCVLVTRAGAIWVGTDQGAGLYDGKTFRTLGSETNLAGPNVRRITEDAEGTIWFCSDSWPNAGAGGGLTSLRAGQWKAYREADGLPSGYVVNYFRDRSGRQFAATLKGLAEFTAGRWAPAFPAPAGTQINWGSGCLAEFAEAGLLYSTGREVFRLQDGIWQQLPAGIPHEHGIAVTADGVMVAVGRPNQGRSVFLEWAGDRWVPVSAEFSTPRGYTEDIRVAPDGSVWVAGYDCLVRWARQGSQWREFTDLPPPKLVDAQGGVWFAQTRGLFTPGGPAVLRHQGRWEPLGDAYDELVNHRGDNSVWGWGGNRLTRWQGTNRTDYPPTQTGLATYVAAHGDSRRSFWLLGQDARGNPAVVRHAGDQWQTVPVPELAGLSLWRTAAGSSNGVWFAGDQGAGTGAVLVRVSPGGNLRLVAPAQQVGTLRMQFREDRYGAVWLYGDAGLFRWVLGQSTQWDSLGNLPSRSVVSCVERGDELWFGYNGATGGRSALIALRNGACTHFPVATLGNLTLANDGTLFADGVGQVFRIAHRPDAVPVVQQLRTAETAQSVVQDLEGHLWVGAGDAVFRFRSNPRPLRLVLAGASRIHADDALLVTATALDRFRTHGTGLGAVFSSRVDGGEWSPFARDEKLKLDTSRLKVGPHRLEVICQDAAGNRRSEPATHHFQVVATPLQEQAWFVPGLLGLVAVMAGLAMVAVNARRRLAEYARTLESKVAERTAELQADIERRGVVEAFLRASEQRFAQVFQCSPVLATITNLADKRLLDANQLFCEVSGYAREELIGQFGPQLEFWHDPVQRDRLLALIRETGSVRNAEVQARTRAGQILDLLVSAERVELPGGPAVLIFGVNVTESRRAETARQASEARYRALFDYAPEGILIGDAQSNYLDANASMCRMLGYTHDELVGLNARDIIAPTETPLIGPTIDAIHRQSDHHQEWTFRRKDGSLFPVEVRGTRTPDGNLLGLVRDLTERKEAEAALRAKDELLRLVIDLVPHFIFAKDRHSRFLFANRAVAESVGLPPDQLVGRSARDLPRDPAEAEAFMRDDREVIASGKPKFVAAERLTDVHGRVRIHQTTKIPFRLPGTGEPALLGVAIDITEQQRVDTALRESEARLREAQRIAKVGSWEWDLGSGRLFWSDEIFHLFELAVDRTQPFYQAYRSLIHPDDVAAVNRAYADAEQRQAPYEITHRLLFPDGRIKWVQEHGEFEYSATGAPIRSRGTMQDVTERHQATVTGVLLTAIVESSSDAIIGKDLEGVVTSWNAGAERMFGWPAGEILGLPINRIIPADRQAEEITILTRIRAGERVEHFETERQRKDGSRITVSVTISPIRDATGKVVGASKVARDITERQRMERLLEWEMRALERLVSTASLGELLDDLALGVEQHAPGAICSILLLDDDEAHLRHGAAPSLPDAYNQAISGVAIGAGVGSCGTAAATNRQVVVADIAEDPLWVDFRELALAHGLRACWSTPIPGSNGKLLGTFAIYYRAPRTPHPAELALIKRAQHLAGLAIERKRAEESLQMTRLSVDRAGDSIFWLGRDGRIHYANNAACVSRGYSREELLGMSIFDLDPDYQPGVWGSHFEELKRLGALTLETRHRAKDGRLFPIEVNANYVLIRGQEFNFCFVRDITARRQVERRRAAEHMISRILAESASLAAATPKILGALGASEGWEFGELWKVDDTDGRLICQETWSAPGRHHEALEAQTRRLRFGSGEGLPGWVYQGGDVVVIPEVSRESRFVRAKEALAAGLTSAIAFPLRAGGPVSGVMTFLGARRMEVDPELVEMLSTLGNQIGQFMARKLAQEELQRFVALSPSVIYALRFTPGGLRAYWVSDNLFNLTGYRPSESVHGNWWTDHLHPEDRDRVLGENLGVGDADHQVLEFRFRRKDGSYVSLRDEKRLRRDATGTPIEIIGAWTDITDRVSLEKQLRQAQKMEAIGLLSGGIAHDFNNLLGTVIGNAQLATLDLAPDHPATESLEQILTASQRAAHLVQQILTFARQERTERHRISPVPVVEESVRLLRSTLPAGVRLTLLKGEGLPAILADETQIQQVLINLGTNSWHALEGGPGRISVELTAVDVDAELAGSSPDLSPGPYLRIRVEDTGRGMEAATLERIFEPFFTTKEVGKGTGLGLSVVHGIIRAHEGAITVRSAVGVGTTFDLFLPAAAPDNSQGRQDRETHLRLGQGERLLLVDDQPEMLRTNRRGLERLGYQIVACQDSAEALAQFQAAPADFALLLTDLNMPGMNGVELTRAVLRLRPGLPVILSSGFIGEDLRAAALAAGVREVLRKPATLQQLSDTIAKLLCPSP